MRVLLRSRPASAVFLSPVPSPSSTHRLFAGKERQKHLVIVHLDIIVLGLFTVDLTLNLVASQIRSAKPDQVRSPKTHPSLLSTNRYGDTPRRIMVPIS